jgi:hypothetical protein
VRGALLIPFILMLIYLGAFAEKNAFPDLILVLFFGILGWVLEKLKFPRPPLILGLVLGGLAESRLFLSMGNYGITWLWRPMVLAIMALTLFGAFYPFFKAKLAKRKTAAQEAGNVQSQAVLTEAVAKRYVSKPAVLFALLLVVVLCAALWQSRTFNVRAGLFPWVVGFPMLAFSLVQLTRELRGKAVTRSQAKSDEEESEVSPELVRRRTAGMFGWIVGYFLAIWLLGFPIGGALCSFLQLKFDSREKWLMTIVLTVALWAFIYVLFERLLHVPFPAGYIFELLGWAE